MKNLAFSPAARSQATSMSKVLQSAPAHTDGEWVKTSICLRKQLRQELKTYAATHDTTIQQVIDEALVAYLSDHAI